MSVIYDFLLDCFRAEKKTVLDAADVGAMPANGMPVEAITSEAAVTIPAGGKLYTLNIEQNTTITFPSPGNATCYFWLYLTTGATEYSFSLSVNITWDNGTGPDMSATNTLYRLAFLWDAPTQKWLGSEFWEPEVLS